MMGSLVSISKMSQFVIVIIPLEDFNIVVLILVMEHALVNVLNGNLVWSVIRVDLQSQSTVTKDRLAKLVQSQARRHLPFKRSWQAPQRLRQVQQLRQPDQR